MTESGVALPEEASTSHPQSQCLSFATDLLGAVDAVKKKNQTTLKVYEELTQLVKLRAAVEEEYAKNLQKVAAQSEGLLAAVAGGHADTTFGESMESFRADLLNKAVQHGQLSKALLTEVHEPINQVRSQMATQSKDLSERVALMTKNAKALDQKYRHSYSKFEKAYQTAVAACASIVDHGGTPPRVDSHAIYKRHKLAKLTRQSSSLSSSNASQSSSAARESTPVARDEKEAEPNAQGGARKKSLQTPASLLTQVVKSDLTSWLLPTEKERSQGLITTARELLENAELCRFGCRDHYDALAVFAKHATHQLQVMLTEWQMLEERCIDEMQVMLRKHVVFESSCLANQQYDLQLLFKLIDDMDKDRDLLAFIKPHAMPFPGHDITNVLTTLGISTTATAVPPPPLLPQQRSSDPTAPDPAYPVLSPTQLLAELKKLDGRGDAAASSHHDATSPTGHGDHLERHSPSWSSSLSTPLSCSPDAEAPSTASADAPPPRLVPASAVLRVLMASRGLSDVTPRGLGESISHSSSSSLSSSDGDIAGLNLVIADAVGGLTSAPEATASPVKPAVAASREHVLASPEPVPTADGGVEWRL